MCSRMWLWTSTFHLHEQAPGGRCRPSPLPGLPGLSKVALPNPLGFCYENEAAAAILSTSM